MDKNTSGISELKEDLVDQQKYMDEFFTKKISKNLLDKSRVVIGKFINVDGRYIDNPAFSCYLLPVEHGKTYTISGASFSVLAFNENLSSYYILEKIETGTIYNITFTSRSNTWKYVGISWRHKKISTDGYIINEGDKLLPYDVYGKDKKYVNNDVMLENVTELQVGSDKPYKTIKSAVESVLNPSVNNRYKIVVDAGTYDLYEEFGGAAYVQNIPSNDYWGGLVLPDYVDLEGATGNPSDVILKFEIPSSEATDTNTTKISTLNIYGNNTIKNITIKGKRVRYSVHDESGHMKTDNYCRIVENCVIEHDGGGWSIENAYSVGFRNNCSFLFKNCKFISLNKYALTFHDYGKVVPSRIKIIGCKFLSKYSSIRFGSLGDLIDKHKVDIIGCSLKDIKVFSEDGISSINHYSINGYGNSKCIELITIDDSLIEFSDEVSEFTVSSTFAKGDCVKISVVDTFTTIEKTNNVNEFYGVVVDFINSVAKVKTSGYIQTSNVNAVSLSGLVGISNGSIASVTDRNEAFGYIDNGHLYLY